MSSGSASGVGNASGTSHDDSRAIIEGMRAGDARAFEKLVRDHIGRLRSVALRLLRDPDDADDAVQEAFLNAFRNFSSFRGDARLGTWLHRIVVNVALQRLRKRKREDRRGEVIDIDALLPRFQENGLPEHLHTPWLQTSEELAARAETREQVRLMIDKLPDNYRTVLILRDIEELDTAETARMLELTPGTVKVRLHRARQALRNLLEQEFELTHER